MDLRVDEMGYLFEPADWSEEVARDLARAESIELTDDHWEVIRFMREYLDAHQIAPDVRHVMKHMTVTRGAGRNHVFELFPFGYVQQACKIAGMKRPRAWSTG